MTAARFDPTSGPPIGRVLVTHGLNVKPAVMDGLVAELCAAGLSCLRVSLYPTTGGRKESADEVQRRWLGTVARAHDELSAESPSLPVHALGFSLGAMVTVAHLVSSGTRFDRMVLLAPPFALTRTASSVQALTPLARTGLALPSNAPRSVRQRWATPLSEYAALLSLISRLRDLPDAQRIGEIPTRVLLEPHDELVSAAGVERWMASNELDAWSVWTVQDRVTPRRILRHLVVSEQALGPRAWDDLTRAAAEHLSGRGPNRPGPRED